MKTRVRAVIIKDGKILLIHRIKECREYWVFPGGGIEETDESKQKAVERECLEEIGVNVGVGDLFAEEKNDQAVEFFYRCEILSGEVGTGKGPEFQFGSGYKGTYELQWIDILKLHGFDVKPEAIKEKIMKEVV